MERVEFQNLLEKLESSKKRNLFLKEAKEGEQYFLNKNSIKRIPVRESAELLKTADNRISHAWHTLLVMQKMSYLFSKEPAIDTGDEETNREVLKVLGDEWGKILNELVKEASNKAVGWLYYYIDEDGKFKYALIESEYIIPIFTADKKKRLAAVICMIVEEGGGNFKTTYQYWDKDQFITFEKRGSICVKDEQNSKAHPFGEVPFIYFNNNSVGKNDLFMYKDLIDEYDKKYSGFANDLDDIQEIIFILQGYGGEDLEEFMSDLKSFKAVKTDEHGDVRTVKAEIPLEARRAFLEDTKKAIFLFGMGVNPDRENFGDSSGVALKFLYSLLELKASATRIEFDCSIKVFIRAILRFLGKETGQNIKVTYYKNMITNDKEKVEILAKSGGMLSLKTSTKNHPYTENLDEELLQIEKEKSDEYKFGDIDEK